MTSVTDNGRFLRVRVVLLILIGLCLRSNWLSRGFADQIQLATDRPQPKSPEESARCMKLASGFRMDLVAAEPLVREPTALAFDEQGRLFVGEIHGYNLDGYLDIVELNKTGKLDREVRRVRHATPESQAAAKKETYGTVRLLRDTDGDGRMDRADVWADRIPPCYGLIASRGGVIAVGAPHILYLADRDGNGKAEVQEILYTGFVRELIERGINSPRQGPDNWIYVAAGGGGGTITGPKLKEPVVIGHTDFRFKSDGTAIEPVTGRENMFGLTMTDFGDRFHTIMTYVIPIPHRDLARNPNVQSPPTEVDIVPSRKLFPISQPDPWRKARGSDPAWVRFYGERETQPNGQFTASSGQLIYGADAFPQEYRGNYFVCDPANNLIHRNLLQRDGSSYVAGTAPENETTEFLASTDQWFRPMSLNLGPDGAIYVVDMYREIVEDFSAIPRFLQQQYLESLIAGKDHGRIWRLSWQGDSSARIKFGPWKINASSVDQLVKLLDHPNAWQRETAQRLLVERRDPAARPMLEKLVRDGKTPPGRMHALQTLSGIAQLAPAELLIGLNDESWGVRMHALQLAVRFLDEQPQMLDRVTALADDPDPRVRLQTALTLGESQQKKSISALIHLAVQHGEERWMSTAILSSVGRTSDKVLAGLLAAGQTNAGTQALLGPLAESIAAGRDAVVIGKFLQQVVEMSGPKSVVQQLALLEGLSRGLARGKATEIHNEVVVHGVEQLLASNSPDVAARAVQIAGQLKLSDSPAMRTAWENARKSVLDETRPLSARMAAISTLRAAPWAQKKSLTELLNVRQPTELQLAVIKAVGNAEDLEVAAALLANWTGVGPPVQDAIVETLFARQDRLPQLLDAVEQGKVPVVFLGALRREQLTEHSQPRIRQRARQLLTSRIQDERASVLKRYASALTLPGNPERGHEIYRKNCASCHKIGKEGNEVGPDLLAVRTRPDETLLVDILDPSGSLARGFTTYSITTSDGRVHTGLLAGEAATSVTLKSAAEPKSPNDTRPVMETVLLRKDIEEMRAMSKSLMPDGLEKELSPQHVADLIGFLRHSLGPVIAPGVVLFDDQPEFLAALKEGVAKARLTKDDKFSGEAALLLTTGQRYSPRIAGWEYRIVEKPLVASQPAERSYRYLRFSWKSAGAKGLLFELAANGAWPPADQPLRRYYSGANTSGWKATEVSPDVPEDWTVVTVDLWKDFGDFTLTGIAPTALGGDGLFDKIELLQSVP